MNYSNLLLPLAAILLGGCTTPRQADLDADRPEDRAQIEQRLNQVFDAATKKELERLDRYHFYGPKFTKFGGESAGRQDAAAARQGEHDALVATQNLAMRAEDLKVDVFGDVGIATFIMNFSFQAGNETISRKASSTMVFVRDEGEWKIAHEHFSTPQSNP